MAEETFAAMLTGGHPNSLGRTVEVVDRVLADQRRLRELIPRERRFADSKPQELTIVNNFGMLGT